VADLRVRNIQLIDFNMLVPVACRAEVSPVMEEVHQFHFTSRVSADSLHFHCGKEGSRQSAVHEPLPGVFPSEPSPSYAHETQLPACYLFGIWPEGS